VSKVIHRRKFVLGITGGIASGKSTVMKMLADAGIPTVCSDALAHDCIRAGKPAYRAICRSFGVAILGRNAEIDRKALGRLVFADEAARRRLEKFVHPCVVRSLRKFIRERSGVIALDIPLLYEAGLDVLVDAVVVVGASRAEQIRRLRRRDGLSRPEALQRLAAQLPLSEKRRRADFTLENSGTLAQLRRRLMAYLCMIQTDPEVNNH